VVRVRVRVVVVVRVRVRVRVSLTPALPSVGVLNRRGSSNQG